MDWCLLDYLSRVLSISFNWVLCVWNLPESEHTGTNEKELNTNIYVIQQDTQCFMIKFIHNTWWLDFFRTSTVHTSGAFSSCMLQIWYVVILRVSITSGRIEQYANCHIPNLQHTAWKTLLRMDYWVPKHVEPPNVMNKLNQKHCVSCWITYILQDDTRPIQYQINKRYFVWRPICSYATNSLNYS